MDGVKKTIQDLPEDVVVFLSDTGNFEFTQKFFEKFKVNKNRTAIFLGLLEEIVLGETKLEELPFEAKVRLGIAKDQANAAAIEIATNRLLPIAGVIGDVAGQIALWGGDVEQIKGGKQVAAAEATAETFVRKTLKEVGAALPEEVLQHRLELILVSYVKGVRDQNETLQTLTRAQKVGGLEWVEADARDLLKAVDDKLAFVKISFKDEKAPEVQVAPVKKVMEAAVPVKKVDSVGPAKAGIQTAKNKAEIEKITRQVKADQKAAQEMIAALSQEKATAKKNETKRVKNELDQIMTQVKADRKAAQELIAALTKEREAAKKQQMTPPTAPTKAAAVKDLEIDAVVKVKEPKPPVVPARLEPKSSAVIPAKAGPVSRPGSIQEGKRMDPRVKPEDDRVRKPGNDSVVISKKPTAAKPRAIKKPESEAEKIMVQVLQAANIDLASEEKRGRLVAAIDSRLRDVRDAYEVRNQLEAPPENGGLGLQGVALGLVAQKMEELISAQTKISEAQKRQEIAAVLVQKKAGEAKRQEELQQQEERLLAKRYAEITGRPPSQVVVESGSAGRPSAAVRLEESLARQEAQIDTAKVKQAVLSSAKPQPKEPKFSAGSIAATASGRPQVTDVRFTKHLEGPVEELRGLTLVEFRRLAGDPKAAAEKIQDKVLLLEEMGYDKKIAAVQAWRACPVNQIYLALSREAIMNGRPIIEIALERAGRGEPALTPEEIEALMDLNAALRF